MLPRLSGRRPGVAVAAIAATLSLAFVSAPAVARTVPPSSPPAQAAAPTERPATMTLREEGLVADYFAGPGTAETGTVSGAVIVLGGSEGGLRGSRSIARRLAEAGIPAIAVSYFGESGQLPLLEQVPIEPVGRALDWLQAQPEIRGPIAILGVSKGAELALVVASREPEIRAVVAGMPSSVIWAGINQTGGALGSSWTSEGRPLPHAPYNLSRGFTGILNLYIDSLASAPAEARIPVERINGPILMISGEADGLWPSARMAAEIEQRLEERGFGFPVVNIVYPDAGHAAFGPPLAAETPNLDRAISLGGTIPGLLAARSDGWPRILDFLRRAVDPAAP